MNTNDTPFKAKIRANIHEFIRDCIKHGTTAASMECLMQCVKTPPVDLSGVPEGTNAQCEDPKCRNTRCAKAARAYRQLFREVCEGDKIIQSFLL